MLTGYHDSVPDSRTHRSSAPEDDELFGAQAVPVLCEATQHLVWLSNRGYAERSSLALVGDRFRLVSRQRDAVRRCSCSDEQLERRAPGRVPPEALRGRALAIDGFNLLITVESALGGGVVLVARDGCFRDLANLRGTWRRVLETQVAIELVGEVLSALGPSEVVWHLDHGVSNSGRLRALIEHIADARSYPWRASLTRAVDAELGRSEAIVASADSGILDTCRQWTNLARTVVLERVPHAWLVDLSGTLPRASEPSGR